MHRYKYRAINSKGRVVLGVLAAASEQDLFKRLEQVGLNLVRSSKIESGKKTAGMFGVKIKTRELIQLFTHLEQLQGAGVPLLDSLADIRDTTQDVKLRDIMTEIHREVSEGASLSEAMSNHPVVFTNIYISLVKAGEETGDLTFVFNELLKYLRWIDEMQSKIKKATRYPMILLFAVVGVVTVMMGYVVPQITDFIKNMDQELPAYTVALIDTSNFFKAYWWAIAMAPVLLWGLYKGARYSSDDFCYTADAIWLRLPVAGTLIRKISIARFCQTFGSLYASGIDVIGALKSARNTVSNLALSDALESVITYVQQGEPLSNALNFSGEFPSLVVRMVKVGEESGKLAPVVDQVSAFYTKDVEEAIDGMIASIEPTLTGVLGLMILWIAAGVFGPIYDMMGKLDM